MMTTNAHTPTPWALRIAPALYGMPEYLSAVVGQDGNTIRVSAMALSSGDEADANAAFIVRAVNAHEELVAALKCALGHMTGNMDGDWSIASDPIALARAVLAKLEAAA